jgi:hypothetical protein
MGYSILPKGTVVEWEGRHGASGRGEVVGVELNPNRKPGIGRVTYEIRFSPAYHPVRVHASRVTPVKA